MSPSFTQSFFLPFIFTPQRVPLGTTYPLSFQLEPLRGKENFVVQTIPRSLDEVRWSMTLTRDDASWFIRGQQWPRSMATVSTTFPLDPFSFTLGPRYNFQHGWPYKICIFSYFLSSLYTLLVYKQKYIFLLLLRNFMARNHHQSCTCNFLLLIECKKKLPKTIFFSLNQLYSGS